MNLTLQPQTRPSAYEEPLTLLVVVLLSVFMSAWFWLLLIPLYLWCALVNPLLGVDDSWYE
jgi:hypothetical protein